MLTSNAIKEVNFTFDTLSLQGLACGSEQQKGNIVLCLHGWLDNAASFLPLLPYFQQNMPEKQFIALDWADMVIQAIKALTLIIILLTGFMICYNCLSISNGKMLILLLTLWAVWWQVLSLRHFLKESDH